ncbi:hypothetical protein DL766_007583 [Monosporascus sp. MC13-8B]|nr:hypothetical protein DL763_008202 [Monosporascus cannonballus]RYP22990.1 hypothetical protein DL766_007583 [Monosporascus sp. MC13-8B]
MAAAAAPNPTADQVAQCLGGFETITSGCSRAELDGSKERTIAAINDELSRFKLWSGNIGAHRTGRSSLDYRLRDSSRLREQVGKLLDDLANGKKTPWDEEMGDSSELDAELKDMLKDEEFEFDSELDQLCADIADIISSLLRLSMSIRNPAPHDRFISTEYANAKYYNHFDIQHVQAKYKDAGNDLVRRLGEAISRRRQYFNYRKSHHAKLSRGIDFDEGRTEACAKSTVASSIPLGMKDPGKSVPGFGELDEDDRSDTGISLTSYATTAPDSQKLRVPPLPKQYIKGPFECPFCFMLISVANRLQWKKHVLADLRPYTCLFEDCLTANTEYGSRHEWIGHVLQRHWKVWRCPDSCEGSWSSEGGLRRHLRELHPDIATGSDLNVIIARGERKKPLDGKIECQLCNESLDSINHYQRHVGKHQVDLALFALPTIDDGEESGDDRMADDGEELSDEGDEKYIDNHDDKTIYFDEEQGEKIGEHESMDAARENMLSPEPGASPESRKQKKLHKEEKESPGGGFMKLFGRNKNRQSKLPENATADVNAMLAQEKPQPQTPTNPTQPSVVEGAASKSAAKASAESEHAKGVTPAQTQALPTKPEPTFTPSPEKGLSRVDTADTLKTNQGFSRFNQGPLTDQPAFVPDDSMTDSEDKAAPPPIARHASKNISPESPVEDNQPEEKGAPSPSVPMQDRWAAIRRNAAERAARKSEEQSRGGYSRTTDGNDTSVEEFETRIKARVAELTGNMEGNGPPSRHRR